MALLITDYRPPGSGKTKTIVAIVGALLSGQFGNKGTAISRPQADVSSARRNVNAMAPKKLLVCAPSNAAVDELVMRFKHGVRTMSGDFQKPSIIRLGKSDAINANVLDVTLDELVNARLNMMKPKASGAEDIHQIMMDHKSTCDEINTLRATLDGLKANGKSPAPEQQREFEILKRKKQQLSNKIDAARDSGDMVARDAEINRRKVQQEILDGAHVICATLSGSGHEMFQNLNIEFETVIIDEAAQSIELSALIPLKYGCTKCILVGDPKQLPPTVLSREAARFQYEQSLFVRMQNKHAEDVHLLDTQYRMHPEISMFPSKEFYDGRLLDGEGMLELRAKPWHQSEILGPYRFFDVQGVQQNAPSGHSLINIAEIEMALRLFARLTTDCAGYDFKGMVGIITPYKSQLRELRARFSQKYGDSILSTVEFNTTDAFQGRECEVIIFSCVRASVARGIGFLSDIRRMNVGITRAKSSLWVLGNSQSLRQGDFWNRLIEDAKRRDRFSGAEVLERLRKPLLQKDSRCVNPDGRSPTEHFPTVKEDVEMVDAPPASAFHDISASEERVANSYAGSDVSAKTLHAEQTTSAKSSDEFGSTAFLPSGGGNGLNEQSNCGLCGSSLHPTFACSNIEARSMSTMKCFRCGSLDHRKDACTAERCLECGKFGHSAQVCTNSYNLPKSEKERVRHSEASHKLSMQRSQETQRRKQLGEHAKEAPVVRATSTTPPPPKSSKTDSKHLQQNPSKRRRGSPPPLSAPRGPKSSKLKHHKVGVGQCSVSEQILYADAHHRHTRIVVVKMKR